MVNKVMIGDCEQILKRYIENETIDLIITSPPYADARKKCYNSIKPDDYVDWFLPRSLEFKRVLKSTGTFILNIKEKPVNGERHTYVIDLIKSLRSQGWYWTEEFVWCKKNCFPGKWDNRFRDAWERCLQFNKMKKFNMYQENVMVPMGEWALPRLKKLGKRDKIRKSSGAGSGLSLKIENWTKREKAFPTNVIQLPTECGNVGFPAAYPIDLPIWFIKLFTKEGDWILDPFAGSGSTGIAAIKLKRNFILIEIEKKFKDIILGRLKNG